MSVSDPIADMLNRMRNAHQAGQDVVEIPHARLKTEIARILKAEGYVRDYTVESSAGKKTLRIYLKYVGEREPGIRGLRRISRPGWRRYVSRADVPKVLNGLGTAVLTTSAGVMTDGEARRKGVGGEVLCHVW